MMVKKAELPLRVPDRERWQASRGEAQTLFRNSKSDVASFSFGSFPFRSKIRNSKSGIPSSPFELAILPFEIRIATFHLWPFGSFSSSFTTRNLRSAIGVYHV